MQEAVTVDLVATETVVVPYLKDEGEHRCKTVIMKKFHVFRSSMFFIYGDYLEALP